MESQLLYDIPQAQAQLGGISRSKLYMEIATGRVRTVKIGTRTFIPRDALEDYVALVMGSDAA